MNMTDERLNTSPRTVLFWAQRALLALCVITLVACAAAPGMRLDPQSDDLKSRADLLTIDPPTVKALRLQSRESAQQALPPGFQSGDLPYQYRVAPQDVLQVTVWNRPELNNPSNTSNELSGRVVNADGSMYYPFVGSVMAGGKTAQEVRNLITTGLTRVIKQPQVDVSVLQYRSQRVVVSGEVRTPGTVPITDIPPDLTKIIASAGGTTNDADLANVTVTRGQETVRLDLQALYYNGDLRSNIRLQNGDIVNVPERRASKVFVTGEVIRPAALMLPRGPFTLADALAEAGGVNPLSANAGQIYVLRQGADARPKVYHLNAQAPDALLLADQFELNARDVVYVDAATVVRWARVLNNILAPANLAREVLNDTVRGLPR
jgi:polysaccharide biosynthesis/export protein